MLLAAIVALIFIPASTIVWLLGALIISSVNDGLAPFIAAADPRVGILSNSVLNTYAIIVFIIDIGLIVWWWLSSHDEESQEARMAAPY